MGFIYAFQKNFTKWNKVIFIAALLFSGLSLIALFKVAPKSDMQNFKALAKLTEQNNQVTRKFSNSLSFSDVTEGDSLYGGDQVFTGKDSSAKIVFSASKNELSVPSDSLIVIDSVNSVENVEIKKGLADFFIKKDQVMNIVKNDEVITLVASDKENSAGTISFSKDQKLVLSVSRGEINVNEGKGTRKVTKNETMQIKVTPPLKVRPFSMDRPAFGENVDIWKGISLSWSTTGQVEVTLSKSKDFSEIVDRANIQTSPYVWMAPIEVGRYFLKAKFVNTNEQVIIPLTMKSSYEISQYVPATNAQVVLSRGEKLKLSWGEVPAKLYKVKIIDGEGRTNVFEASSNQIEVPRVYSNEIQWQVAPVLNSGIELPYSVLNKLSVKFNGDNKILSPLKGSKYQWKEGKIKLSWESMSEEEFDIKIYEGKNKKLIWEKATRDSTMEITPASPGEYTFDLKSKDYPSLEKTSTHFFVIGKIAEWKEKEALVVDSVDESEKSVALHFLPNTEDFSNVEFVVYRNDQILDRKVVGKKHSNTFNYKMKTYGNYCFELRSVRDFYWVPSGKKCVNYKNIPAFATLPVAKNVILKFIKAAGPEGYTIELPIIEHAAQYEVQVFQDLKGKKIVYTEKSKSNIAKWYTKKSGAYFYRYRVIDSKGNLSDFSKIAKLVFPISPLTEWRE